MSDPPLNKRRVGRPRDPAKVARILDAAWTLFLERGVEAVAMETIASRAAVSKSTLYSAFADKIAVFEAVMLREMERIEAAQGVGDPGLAGQPIEAALRAFGLGIMSFLASDVAIGFYGPLSAEVRRHPDLSATFWRLGPGRTRANLAALLAGASARGELAIDDPVRAADALFGVWQGFSNLQLAFDNGAAEVRASIEERVDAGIALFLTLYATPSPR